MILNQELKLSCPQSDGASPSGQVSPLSPPQHLQDPRYTHQNQQQYLHLSSLPSTIYAKNNMKHSVLTSEPSSSSSSLSSSLFPSSLSSLQAAVGAAAAAAASQSILTNIQKQKQEANKGFISHSEEEKILSHHISLTILIILISISTSIIIVFIIIIILRSLSEQCYSEGK